MTRERSRHAAAYAFDRKGRAGYQTPAHRVSQTVAKKESDRRRSKAGEATKRYLDNRQAEDGPWRSCVRSQPSLPEQPDSAGCHLDLTAAPSAILAARFFNPSRTRSICVLSSYSMLE